VWTLRREAARVVLLDPDDRVLLLSARDPADASKGEWWELPGGGIEHGEPSSEAAARELHEETGIEGVDMGPCLWRHHAKFTFAGFNFDQQEFIHVARFSGPTDQAGYRPAGLEAIEAMAFKGFQWWDVADLGAAGVRVIPPWLVSQLSGGIPETQVDMGELGDVF
jgi:8-oxo-dGTP pyrophosphatase MutT (NUDIX family)